MNLKKMFLLFSFVFFLFSNIVYAQEESGLAGVAETIENLFGFIPNIITLEKLIGEDAAAIFWAKFLVWLLLFAAFFFGATKAFKDNKRVAAVVALVFALIGTLMMPNGWIINIFQSYGFLSGLLIWVVPVAAGFYLVSKIQQRLLKALIYLLMIFVLLAIDSSITSSFGENLADNVWYSFFKLLLAVVIIAFLWNLLFAGLDAVPHGGGEHGSEHREGDHRQDYDHKKSMKEIWDWINKDKDDKKKDGEDKEKKVEKIELKILWSFLRILTSLRSYINKTTSRQSWEDRFDDEFNKAVEKLTELTKLEKIEIRLEFPLEHLTDENLDKVGFVKNKKHRENLRALITRESHSLRNLISLVAMVENSRKNNDKAQVVIGLSHMIDLVSFLIKINIKELEELA